MTRIQQRFLENILLLPDLLSLVIVIDSPLVAEVAPGAVTAAHRGRRAASRATHLVPHAHAHAWLPQTGRRTRRSQIQRTTARQATTAAARTCRSVA